MPSRLFFPLPCFDGDTLTRLPSESTCVATLYQGGSHRPCRRLRGVQYASEGVGEAAVRKWRERRVDERQGDRRQWNVVVRLTDWRCGVGGRGGTARRRCRGACRHAGGPPIAVRGRVWRYRGRAACRRRRVDAGGRRLRRGVRLVRLWIRVVRFCASEGQGEFGGVVPVGRRPSGDCGRGGVWAKWRGVSGVAVVGRGPSDGRRWVGGRSRWSVGCVWSACIERRIVLSARVCVGR